jgi:hypothetical protein
MSVPTSGKPKFLKTMKTLKVIALLLLTGNAFGQLNIDSGLIAHYPFSANALDQSGNGFDGTVVGASLTQDRFGNDNAAYDFDGVTDHIRVDDAYALRLNQTDFTINAWVYERQRNASFGSMVLAKRGDGSQRGYHLAVLGQGTSGIVGTVHYVVSQGNDPDLHSETVIPLNEWHFITIVYTVGDQTVKAYINGVLDSVVPGIPTPNEDFVDLYIGRDSKSSGLYFNGLLDDIRIYNRALSEDEISSLYDLKTSVGVEPELPKIQVYPNPFNTKSFVQLPGAFDKKTVLLYGLDGRVVRNYETSEATLQLIRGDLTSGIYLLEVCTSGQIWRTKLLVN